MLTSTRIVIAIIFLFISLASCTSDEVSTTTAVDDLILLRNFMTGSFSSQEQSLRDSGYYDIRLEMAPIWPDQPDGYWLYVEQAVVTDLDEPYRQRVYHLTRVDDTTFKSAVYTLDEPLRFAGAGINLELLVSLTPDSLTERAGCAIILTKEDDSTFIGGTVESNCLSQLRGSSYATSLVRITPRVLYSWDRGFDADGNQVWGAETGGYVFKSIRRGGDTDEP